MTSVLETLHEAAAAAVDTRAFGRAPRVAGDFVVPVGVSVGARKRTRSASPGPRDDGGARLPVGSATGEGADVGAGEEVVVSEGRVPVSTTMHAANLLRYHGDVTCALAALTGPQGDALCEARVPAFFRYATDETIDVHLRRASVGTRLDEHWGSGDVGRGDLEAPGVHLGSRVAQQVSTSALSAGQLHAHHSSSWVSGWREAALILQPLVACAPDNAADPDDARTVMISPALENAAITAAFVWTGRAIAHSRMLAIEEIRQRNRDLQEAEDEDAEAEAEAAAAAAEVPDEPEAPIAVAAAVPRGSANGVLAGATA